MVATPPRYSSCIQASLASSCFSSQRAGTSEHTIASLTSMSPSVFLYPTKCVFLIIVGSLDRDMYKTVHVNSSAAA